MGILYGTPEKIEYSHKRKALHPNLEDKAVAAHCDTLSFVREIGSLKIRNTHIPFFHSVRPLACIMCVGLGMFVALLTRFAEHTICYTANE